MFAKKTTASPMPIVRRELGCPPGACISVADVMVIDTPYLPSHLFRIPSFDIVLPVGISFYTFHTITYIVDSARGVIKPTRNSFEFSCYVSLFSQLVTGPIVRFRQVKQDLENIDQAKRGSDLETGISILASGSWSVYTQPPSFAPTCSSCPKLQVFRFREPPSPLPSATFAQPQNIKTDKSHLSK
jgi:hypothetical protein